MNNQDLLSAAVEKLEETANFLRGANFDLRIPADVREAFLRKVAEIDEFCEQYEGE